MENVNFSGMLLTVVIKNISVAGRKYSFYHRKYGAKGKLTLRSLSTLAQSNEDYQQWALYVS